MPLRLLMAAPKEAADLGKLAEEVCIPDEKWLSKGMALEKLAHFCRQGMDVSVNRARRRGKVHHFWKGSIQI